MELFEALGDAVAGELGDKRQLIPRTLIYDEAAAEQLVSWLGAAQTGRQVAVLSDARTREVAGADVVAAFEADGWQVSSVVVADPPGGTPVCDDLTKNALAAELPEADLLVAVGSGVINDLTKWLAGEAGLPYAAFATAASMNGYAAANVAPAIDGVKSLFRARAPCVIATRPSVLSEAPFRLTASGLGDVIAKPVSTADWLVNHLLFGERYSTGIAGVIDRVEPRYLDHPERLAQRQPDAIRALFEALVLSGCAMTLQGSSMPASGGEHLVSHTLDMTGHAHHIDHDLHGRQVGVATIFAAALYQRVMTVDPDAFAHTEVPFEPSIWGHLAEAVAVEHEKKRCRITLAQAALREPGKWATVQRQLAPLLREPERIKRCLRLAGAAHRLEDIGCDKPRFLMAVRACSAMRERFVSVDLARLAGVLPDAAEQIVDELLT